MSEQPENYKSSRKINLGSDKLKIFFLKHLDRIYAAKLHLVSKLPSLADEVQFADLKNAIAETVEDVEKQISRMEIIYTLLDGEALKGSIHGLTGLIEDAFEAIDEQKGEPEMRDLSIIFYLQNIESVEMASFQILQMAAVKLKNNHVNQLLKENYDEAKADRTLLLLISSKYITN
jgi:ferritin-like metal-binding protein YciE